MRFLVISSAPVLCKNKLREAYAPYAREMDVWFRNVEKITLICPTTCDKPLLTQAFKTQSMEVISIPPISFHKLGAAVRSMFYLPYIFFKILFAMSHTDHIHLRCPGNIGLLGCIAQVFFPLKAKTTKYAGNWDPKSKQPWSYRLQKWILGNERLTRNMKILVYGQWPNPSKNIKPFFTATYSETDKTEAPQRKYDLPLRFLFVGSLVDGKRPDYALDLVKGLIDEGIPSELHFYGDGPFREILNKKIMEYELEKFFFLHGNKDSEQLKKTYQKAHFLILPSKSEGWPKVIAEAMWWGVIPIATPISCVPWMLGKGARGILIHADLRKDITDIKNELENKNALHEKAQKAQLWSRQFTLERFGSEIKKLL